MQVEAHAAWRPIAHLQRHGQFIWYQVRLVCFWAHPILLLISAGTALGLAQQVQPAAWDSFFSIFEVAFPLAASVLFLPLLLREQQRRTLPLVGATQCSLGYLYFVRLILTALFLTALTAMLWMLLQLAPRIPDWATALPNPKLSRDLAVWPATLWGGPNGLASVLLTLAGPVALLAGTATILAHLTADVRVGYLVIFALWMFNRAAGTTLDSHPILHNLYLFVRSGGNSEWLTPKLIQLTIGTAGFVLTLPLIKTPERILRRP